MISKLWKTGIKFDMISPLYSTALLQCSVRLTPSTGAPRILAGPSNGYIHVPFLFVLECFCGRCNWCYRGHCRDYPYGYLRRFLNFGIEIDTSLPQINDFNIVFFGFMNEWLLEVHKTGNNTLVAHKRSMAPLLNPILTFLCALGIALIPSMIWATPFAVILVSHWWIWRQTVIEESVHFMPGIGVQLESRRQSGNRDIKLISRDRIRDILILEGFRRWNCIFYLAIRENDPDSPISVIFPVF